MTRWIKAIVGVIVVVLGVLWILPGLGLVQGSMMTGQTMWLVIGIVLALIGAWLLSTLRTPPRKVRIG